MEPKSTKISLLFRFRFPVVFSSVLEVFFVDLLWAPIGTSGCVPKSAEIPPRTVREPAVRTPSKVAFHIAIVSKGLRPPTNASTKSPRIKNGAAVSPLGGLR